MLTYKNLAVLIADMSVEELNTPVRMLVEDEVIVEALMLDYDEADRPFLNGFEADDDGVEANDESVEADDESVEADDESVEITDDPVEDDNTDEQVEEPATEV